MQPNDPFKKLFYHDTDYIAYRKFDYGETKDGILFLSGFKSDMNGTKAVALQQLCCAQKRNFLCFDYFAHGASTGDFSKGTIGMWLENALLVLDKLTAGPQILVGSSMGGWLMLLVALLRPERVKALVGIAAAPDFSEDLIWEKLSAQDQIKLLEEGEILLDDDYCTSNFLIHRDFIIEARKHLLLRDTININCKVRLLHGMHDVDVPYDTALQLAKRLTSQDVTLHLVKNGGHRLSEPAEMALLESVVQELF